MSTRPRATIALGLVIAVVAAIASYVTQVRSPPPHSFYEAKIYTYTDPGTGETYSGARAGLVSDVQLLSEADFDFSDPLDYANALVFFEVRNTSVFPVNNIEFFVLDLGGAQGRFLYKQDAIVPVKVDPGRTVIVRLDLTMYVKGLSDSQIADLVKKVTVELQFDRPLLGGGHVPIPVPSDLEFPEHIYDA